MIKTPKISDMNQAGRLPPEYIVVRIDYNNKLIMPVQEGLELVRSMGTAYELIEEYKKPSRIQRFSKEIQVNYITQQAFNQLLVSEILEPTNE